MIITGKASSLLILILAAWHVLATAAWSQTEPVGSEPPAMEVFARQLNVRMRWTDEVIRWESGGTRLILTALVLEEASTGGRTVRGVKIELSNPNATDTIYLDEEAIDRTRSALGEISQSVARTGFPGRGCVGAAAFWSLYNWPWNKYHELNADFCNYSGPPALVLHGRGRRESFEFADKEPAGLSAILATAIEDVKQH
jgi:hypothetical protein